MADELRTAEEASAEAIHKAKNAAQAVEAAREAQVAAVVAETAKQTKDALLEGLKEVFGDSDSSDPKQMKVLVRRIPILCTSIEDMRQDIADMKDNNKWAVRIIVGGVIVGLLNLLIK